MRGHDGTLRGFFNVCRHRAGPPAEGCGSRKLFRCGYHGWTYDLDGRLWKYSVENTGVDEVCVDFGRPTQRALHDVTADEMRAHHAAGQFPPGSMGPKVESALRFVEAGGRRSIITSLERLPDALAGKAGTHISGRPDRERAQ